MMMMMVMVIAMMVVMMMVYHYSDLPTVGRLRQMIHEGFPCLITIWGILLLCLAIMMMMMKKMISINAHS